MFNRGFHTSAAAATALTRKFGSFSMSSSGGSTNNEITLGALPPQNNGAILYRYEQKVLS